MKHLTAAIALAAALAQPASAITFPSLTTIYIITGAKDSGTGNTIGTATAMQCTNVSGVTTSIRFVALSTTGAVLNAVIVNDVVHGRTVEVSTHGTAAYASEELLIPGTPLDSGAVNIEALQSAVFCTAAIIDAAAARPDGITPHIIRVNPHPGTVE